MIEAKLYATFRTMAEGSRSVLIDDIEGGASVGAVLDHLVARYPDLRAGFYDDEGAVRSYVAIMVNGRDVRHLDGLATPVAESDTLDIFPPVAGGSRGA